MSVVGVSTVQILSLPIETSNNRYHKLPTNQILNVCLGTRQTVKPVVGFRSQIRHVISNKLANVFDTGNLRGRREIGPDVSVQLLKQLSLSRLNQLGVLGLSRFQSPKHHVSESGGLRKNRFCFVFVELNCNHVFKVSDFF